MSEISQPSDWSLISKLRPQLHSHVRTFPQIYRGERWYVLRDESSGRHLRFNASAYEFIGRMNGLLTVQMIWDRIQASLEESALNQDDVIMILTQLYAIEALKSGLPTDAREFFERFQNDRRLRQQRAIMNPLAIRIPLLDPDNMLNRFIPRVRPLFSWGGAILWLFVVGFASLLALVNFPELLSALNQDILSPSNLLLMMLMFIIIKLVHEFAHAFAVKMWGGEVHEMGITLLVLAPVPYVDASATWAFHDKYKRVLVGAVGIMVELFIASLALFVWLAVEPGLLRNAALDALLIGSVSTLLFNANPLLRFDGYYILQDLVEIPNLYTRSGRYYLYLIQRYLFGLESVRSPVTARGERNWFVVYGFAAFFYRLFILVVIVLFLAEEYLFIGVALGTWAIATQVILPVFRGFRFLLTGTMLEGRRYRATTVSALLFTLISVGLLFMPVSLTTHAEGIVWVSQQGRLYAGAEGFVDNVLVSSGSHVEAGTPLIQLRAPSLLAQQLKLEARRRELEIRSAAEQLESRTQSNITKEELIAVNAELELIYEQISSLLVRSEVAGTFVLPDERKLHGSHLNQGQLIGYVISPERMIVRAVVPQTDIGLIRQKVEQVEVRFAERLNEIVNVQIVRETPAGITTLPSRALGAAGGGEIAVKLTDDGTTAAEQVFQVDLSMPGEIDITGVGERAYVRFDHGSEPLASQWLRSGRQLVLSRLSF